MYTSICAFSHVQSYIMQTLPQLSEPTVVEREREREREGSIYIPFQPYKAVEDVASGPRATDPT